MIVPLGKNLRKWLLGLAVAARNRVQTIVARLESNEEEQTEAAGREIAPGDAKTARPGGPPEHWVQLVKRHAPELLQPGSPDVVSRGRSAVFENDAGMDGSAPQDIRELKSDSATLDDGDVSIQEDLSSLPPRTPKAYDEPDSKRQVPAQDTKRQADGDDRIAGVDTTSPEQTRDEAATHAPKAARPWPARVDRPSVSPAGEEKTMHRRTSDRQRDERSVPAEGPRSGSREAKIPDPGTVAAHRSQSTNGPIENARAGAKDRKIIPASEQSGRQDDHGYPKEPEHEADSLVDTLRPVHREISPATGSDTQAGMGESFKELGSSPGTGVKAPPSQTKSSGNDFRQVNEVRIVNDQGTTYPPGDREKVAEKISTPAELSWPSLPGEKDSEDVRDPHLAATWPSLSAERPSEVTLPANQMELHPTEAETRNIERLRRLDEEQKGRPWSASHF